MEGWAVCAHALRYPGHYHRKRADEAQAQLAAIVESSQDAIISKTLEGKLSPGTPVPNDSLAIPAAEAVGQPVTMLIPADRQTKSA